MYPLFITAAKLMGVLFFYWGLANVIQSVISVPYILNPDYELRILGIPTLIGNLLYAILTLSLGFLFIFKTENVASFLKIEKDNNITANWSKEDILKNGIILIGLFIFIQEIGPLLRLIALKTSALESDKAISLLGTQARFMARQTSLIELASQAVPVIFSLVCILGARQIVKFVNALEIKQSNNWLDGDRE
jgi:hypothetical protein